MKGEDHDLSVWALKQYASAIHLRPNGDPFSIKELDAARDTWTGVAPLFVGRELPRTEEPMFWLVEAIPGLFLGAQLPALVFVLASNGQPTFADAYKLLAERRKVSSNRLAILEWFTAEKDR
jgi:hypothetical protein